MMGSKMTMAVSFVLTLSLGASLGRAGPLVGYWSLDNIQGTLVPDLSGSGNDGAIKGAPQQIAGPFGKALQFGGVEDCVDCGNAASLDLTAQVTLACWVKTTDAGDPTGGEMGGQNHYISKHNSYQIKHRTNLLIFAVWDSGAPYATRISIDRSFNNEWHHVVGTYDGKVLKTYVDGRMQGEAAHAGDIDHINLNVNIGKNPNQNDQNMKGGIDEVQIYNRALTAAQVLEVFAGGVASFARAALPDPADGAKGVALPMVKWTGGEGAVLHEVYFGTDPNLTAADFRGSQALTMYYHTPGVTPGQTYYWRIDEVAADGTKATGKVWSFTAASTTAYGPKPRDGMGWLDPAGVNLTWEFGQGAVQHDVYFGTDKTAVEAGDARALAAKQPANSYDPGPLQSNTTYYWRIDEHTATGELNQGAVWTFSTRGGPYDGVKAEYFANPDVSGAPAVVRSESKIEFTWPNGTTEGVNSPAVGIPVTNFSARWSAELHVAFSGEYRFVINVRDSGRLWLDDKLLIERWPNSGDYPEYSSQGIRLTAGNIYSLIMEWNEYNAATGKEARLEWVDPFGERSLVGPGYLQLPLKANRPRPTMGQKDVTPTPLLRWSPGDKAAKHDVYFGTDAQAVAADLYQGRQALDATTFDPGPLEWGKTYYWRVDEVNEASPDSPWTGPVWSFTTADFLVLDDFESYNDDLDAKTTIFDTWIDGFTNGLSGSTVGNITAPFAEQRIVHTGMQSMPLDYDNTKSPYYSEAQRSWDTSQNWSINGVDTLTLYVCGQTANAADKLYVAVEDAAGHVGTVVHPDAAVLTTAQWTEWKIPLSSLSGVNAAKIKKITIGVGDRTKPAQGGTGRIFIDDIRVMKGGN
ncbi:MAG: PA14 domain-containing protein [Planctomycetes bacterium]|nr:PA14 domain-containing protein [Planctomycetota bacterium]